MFTMSLYSYFGYWSARRTEKQLILYQIIYHIHPEQMTRNDIIMTLMHLALSELMSVMSCACWELCSNFICVFTVQLHVVTKE